jgi:hypothetical protein
MTKNAHTDTIKVSSGARQTIALINMTKGAADKLSPPEAALIAEYPQKSEKKIQPSSTVRFCLHADKI